MCNVCVYLVTDVPLQVQLLFEGLHAVLQVHAPKNLGAELGLALPEHPVHLGCKAREHTHTHKPLTFKTSMSVAVCPDISSKGQQKKP